MFIFQLFGCLLFESGTIHLEERNIVKHQAGFTGIVTTYNPTENLTEAIPYNGNESGLSIGSPSPSGTIITPAVAYTGTTLTCQTTTNSEASPTYQWTVDGVTIGTGESYTISAADTSVGDRISCAVNTSNDNRMRSTASITVKNTPPSLVSTSIIENGVYNDSRLICSTIVVDPDEPLNPNYAWTVAGEEVETDILDLATTSARPFDLVECQISVTDSNGDSDFEIVSVTVNNRPPSSPTISISPSSPMINDVLTCSASSIDPDGDTLNTSLSWYSSNGDVVSDSTLPVGSTAAGEVWTCSVSVSDGTAIRTESTSVTIDTPIDTITFSNCAQTGSSGPSQSDCDNAYHNTSLESQVTISEGIQVWTVPLTGTYSIEVWGAEGSRGKDFYSNYYSNGSPGKGAYLYGEFNIIAGDVLKILVGQRAVDDLQVEQKGGAGGGGTFVSRVDDTPLIVAGGGGGSGRYNTQDGGHGQAGPDGGSGLSGILGGSNGSGGDVLSCGFGGNSGAGFYGDGLSECSNGIIAYSFVNGGHGGEWSQCWQSGNAGGFGGGGGSGPHGGAGGGGYSGGGGGGDHNCGNTSGGGGGGSYNAGNNQQAIQGVQSGDGLVIIQLIH